jgi:hypothetical protein
VSFSFYFRCIAALQRLSVLDGALFRSVTVLFSINSQDLFNIRKQAEKVVTPLNLSTLFDNGGEKDPTLSISLNQNFGPSFIKLYFRILGVIESTGEMALIFDFLHSLASPGGLLRDMILNEVYLYCLLCIEFFFFFFPKGCFFNIFINITFEIRRIRGKLFLKFNEVKRFS